ncbi:MAG TPA: adenylate/guanylate cyclase domain-containing protein [Nitrososphaeraceae archaeon]|nr:adenylate/guanylate cyclase domain-containing protein [Nitrososphaeraceae archaeon]
MTETSKLTVGHLRKEDEQIEVSFDTLIIDHSNHDEIIKKIATAINVQLSAIEGGQNLLPFTAPKVFENAIRQDKLFIYGASGCGKSRAIFEIIKSKIQGTEKIHIINPQQSIGEESGRIILTELMNRFTEKDMIIWDNFPDDLMKKDIDNSRKALEIITSKDVKCLLIALKPKYLEMYKFISREVPELYAYEIAYDKSLIRDILVSYGNKVAEFVELYKKRIEPDIDKVAKALWEKEPLPLTAFNYFNELLQKEGLEPALTEEKSIPSVDAVLEAKMLPPRTEYYEHQFELIQDQEDRQSDAEFLYTLKLCYELGLGRAINVVESFQKGIFNSSSPKYASRKLGTWIYLSDQQYSMHDAPREAIKLPDYVKIKATNYLINNFFDIIPREGHQLYSIGIFLGRHLNLVSVDSSDTILPENIYNFMKGNRYLEEGLGQGAGESFSLSEDDLQQKILSRIDIDVEFARALGDSLANSFSSLNKRLQTDILGRLKKNVPFSRGFGESLGRNFITLTKELQEQVFAMLSLQENFQFARGLGMGLGRKLLYLPEELQKEVFLNTDLNLQFATGVGFGLGNIFTISPEEFRQEILNRASRNSEIARGLGLGLGRTFRFLSKEFQRETFDLIEKSYQFAFGLGYEIGYNFDYLKESVQSHVFKLIEINTGFAFGVALGLAIASAYKSEEFHEWLFEQAERNPQFCFGLGYGYGFASKYLPKSVQVRNLERIQKNSEFARGLGFGLGYTFIFYDREFQQEIFKRAKKNSEFILGLGMGLGILFEQLSSDLRQDLLKRAECDGILMRGIGYGIGVTVNFMKDDLRHYAFNQAENSFQFAIGFGEAIGEQFILLSKEVKEEMFSRASQNKGFAQGLAYRLGQIFNYLDRDLQQKILYTLAKEDYEFAYGLGFGLGTVSTFLREDVRKEAVRISRQNIGLMRGLGTGLGSTFQFLPIALQKEMMERAEKNIPFSIGLGEGLGRILPYLPKDLQEKQFDRMAIDRPFSEGLGYGLGCTFFHLPKQLADKILKYVEGHMQFAYGFGEGLATSFPFLDADLQKEIFAKARQNAKLAEGLGHGLGFIFQYLHREVQGNILNTTTTAVVTDHRESFVKGLGKGFGFDIRYLPEELKRDIFKKANENKQFAFGLGYGLGINFSYQDAHFQNEILKRIQEENIGLAQGLGFALGHIFSYLSKEQQGLVLKESRAAALGNQEFAKGLGNGIGRSFPILAPSLQEDILTLVKQQDSEFAKGLGNGIGRSFRYLDSILQQELLVWVSDTNSQFARNLGYSIGYSFASLNPQIQQQILLEHSSANSEFAKGLSEGLEYGFNYLNKEMQDQILKTLTKEHASLLRQRASSVDSLVGTRINSSSFDHSISEQDDFLFPSFITSKSEDILQHSWAASEEEQEVSFSGLRENFCVCFIDLMNSTKIASNLAGPELDKYYSIFLNAMATIVRNFGGKIIKNAGDALIYYFPDTADSSNLSAFKDVLECGITMIAAHRTINSKMQTEGLPSLNYRISADCGVVAVAKSKSSQSDDLFGSAMNLCAKINSKAPANGMVIGKELYQLVKSMDDFRFEKVNEQSDTKYSQYPAYIVQTKEKRNILNPFKRVPESKEEE